MLQYGHDELKHTVLRRLLTDDLAMCLLYSEPGAGSDLASIATRADRDGAEFRPGECDAARLVARGGDEAEGAAGGGVLGHVEAGEALLVAEQPGGEGEAESRRILNAAQGKDPEFYAFFRALEAYKASLGDGTTLVLSPESEFFRYFQKPPGR